MAVIHREDTFLIIIIIILYLALSQGFISTVCFAAVANIMHSSL